MRNQLVLASLEKFFVGLGLLFLGLNFFLLLLFDPLHFFSQNFGSSQLHINLLREHVVEVLVDGRLSQWHFDRRQLFWERFGPEGEGAGLSLELPDLRQRFETALRVLAVRKRDEADVRLRLFDLGLIL